MRHRRRLLGFLVLIAGPCGFAPAEAPPRLKASWKEPDARIEAFSPDGRSLLTSGEEGFRLRDAETGRVRATLHAARHGLHGPRFSPDGRLLFAKVASEEFKPVIVFDLKAWDVATGRTHGTIPYIAEHVNAATDHYALSPDGTRIATLDNSDRLPMQVREGRGGLDGREIAFTVNASPGLPRVRIWSVPDWKQVALLDGGSHMTFSPDGSALATGSRDWHSPTARIWDAATWRLRADLDGVAEWVKPMTFSADGKLLAMNGRGDETLWEIDGGNKWATPIQNGGSNAPVFSPDGGLLFPNGLPSGRPERNMNLDYPCYDVSSLPPRRLELGDGQFVPQPLTYKEPRILISPMGMRFVLFGAAGPTPQDERTYEVRALPGREVVARSTVKGLVQAEFSPDGRWIALLVGRREEASDGSGSRSRKSIQLVESASARVASTITLPEDASGQQNFAFSPDGRSLVVGHVPGTRPYSPGDPEPARPPANIDVWELQPR